MFSDWDVGSRPCTKFPAAVAAGGGGSGGGGGGVLMKESLGTPAGLR